MSFNKDLMRREDRLGRKGRSQTKQKEMFSKKKTKKSNMQIRGGEGETVINSIGKSK